MRSGFWRAMPDRRVDRGRRGLWVSLAVLTLACLVAGWAAAAPSSHAVERPGESCPDTTPAPGASAAFCEDVTDPDGAGGAGFDLAGLLPLAAAVVVGGILALALVLLVMRRRLPGPLAQAGPGEWWTCRQCGATNIAGSPRCYSCGAWPG